MVNMLPFKPLKVYVASDSMLKLRKAKPKAGHRGPEIATMDKIRSLGANDVEWLINPGVESEHPTMALDNFTQKELFSCSDKAPPNEVGCIAANDPEFEIPHDFEDVVIDDAVSIIMWSGTMGFTKQGGCARQAGAQGPYRPPCERHAAMDALHHYRSGRFAVLGNQPAVRRVHAEVHGLLRRKSSAADQPNEVQRITNRSSTTVTTCASIAPMQPLRHCLR